MSEVNIGIDLGTTNSAIVGYDGGDFRVFKNRYQMEVTPSAIMIGKNNRLIIGQKAYESYSLFPDDVKLEFKRLMGTKEKAYFKSSEKYLTPEELSSEVLKALIYDAQKFYSSEIDYAVITIPAAFKALQCESTNKAAYLAGLEDSSLLMEPIAASVGAASSQFNLNDKWLVYDFGGGTFDVAVVSHQDNILSVIEHSGNNMLGGKNIDEKIIDEILLNFLQQNYNVPTKSDHYDKYLNLRRRLRGIAESLKIELSSINETKVDIYDIGADLDGNEYDISTTISRSKIEKIAQPFIQETIYYCKEVLTNSNLEPNALSKILLVGGPTQMPIFRDTLEEEFGIPLDFSIDPMTAVAKGAAIYCSTIERPAKLSAVSNELKSKSSIELKLSYQSVSSVIDPLVIGEITTQSISDDLLEICFESTDGFWNSSWIPIEDYKFESHLLLKEKSINMFHISIRNSKGRDILCNPENITIRHGVEFDDFKLPHTISVKIKNADEIELLDPIFPRNTSLPARTTVKYISDKTLLPGSNDSINIVIYEGELLDSPEANEILSNLPIQGNEIDRPIPKNTPIDIIFNISNSRILNVTAYIEILDQEFTKRFVPDDCQKDISALHDRSRIQVDNLYEDLEYIYENKSAQLSDGAQIELASLKDRVDSSFIEFNEISNIDINNDPDKIIRIHEDIQKLCQRLYKIKKEIGINIESDRNLLVGHFEESADETRALIEDDEDKSLIPKFNRIYKDARSCYDNEDIIGLKKCKEEMDSIKWQLRMRNEYFLQGSFEYFESIKSTMKNQQEADRLFLWGKRCTDEKDYDGLRKVIRNLLDLLPDPDALNKAYQSGIRKM